MKKLTAILACATALLLTSCLNVNWNIGERIRSGGEVRVGVNVREPVDGKEYHANRSDVRIAPEVSYTRYVPWVEAKIVDPREIIIFADLERTKVRDVKPTGRIVITETTWKAGPAFHKELPNLPTDCYTTQVEPNPQNITSDTLGTIAYKSKPSFWRCLSAAPFDYLIDPALSISSTAVIGIPTACFMAVYVPLDYLINGIPK